MFRRIANYERDIPFVGDFFSLGGWKRQSDSVTLSRSMTSALKSVCAILIIIGHCIIATKDDALSTFNVGWYCVGIFMFISGWGLYSGYKSKLAYLNTIFLKRIPKVIIPFLTAHVIYFVVKSVFGVRFTFTDVIMGLLGNCNVVDNSWYPIAIVLLYVFFWLAFLPNCNETIKLLLLFMFVTAATWVEYRIFGEDQAWWFISNLSFVAGVLLKRGESKLSNKKIIVLLGLVLWGAGYALIPIGGRVLGEYYYGTYVVSSNLESAGLSVALAFLLCEIGHRPSVFDKLGKYSYEMYLMHGIFIWLGSMCGIQNTIAMIVLVIAFTIPVSIVVNRMNTRLWSILQ